jgi:hypothetical protein
MLSPARDMGVKKNGKKWLENLRGLKKPDFF